MVGVSWNKSLEIPLEPLDHVLGHIRAAMRMKETPGDLIWCCEETGDQLVSEITPNWGIDGGDLSKAIQLNLFNNKRGKGSCGGRG
jgi:hypothetical protein